MKRNMSAEVLPLKPRQTPAIEAPTPLHPCDSGLYELVHGTVDVYGAVANYSLALPLEPQDPTINILVNGLGAFKKTMRPLRHAAAIQGRASLSYAPVRSSERHWISDFVDPTGLHQATIGMIVDQLPYNRELGIQSSGHGVQFDSFNLVAHSYGGHAAASFAAERPDSIQSLVFLQAAGMESARNPLRYLPRLPGFFWHELLDYAMNHPDEAVVSDSVRVAKHWLRNPVLSTGEVLVSATLNLTENIRQLRALSIGTALISGEHDHLIPADSFSDDIAGLIDYHATIDADHLGPQKLPELVAEEVEIALQALAAIR